MKNVIKQIVWNEQEAMFMEVQEVRKVGQKVWQEALREVEDVVLWPVWWEVQEEIEDD